MLDRSGISDVMTGYYGEAAYKIHPAWIFCNRRITDLLKKLFEAFVHF
jgi:hypothetical protein